MTCNKTCIEKKNTWTELQPNSQKSRIDYSSKNIRWIGKRGVASRCGYNDCLSDGEGWQKVVGDAARITRRREGLGSECPFEQEGVTVVSASETPAHRVWLGQKGMGVEKRDCGVVIAEDGTQNL
jgi:hypothetical protein